LRSLVIVLVILGILIGGGLLTSSLNQATTTTLPGVRVQTNNPDASTAVVTPSKGALFFVFVGWVLFGLPIPPLMLDWVGLIPEFAKPVLLGIPQVPGGLIPAILTITFLMWWGNRSVNKARREANREFNFSLNPRAGNSIGSVAARRPSITIALIVVGIVLLAGVAAVVFGAFTPR
jgi:hypothetical protein